MGDGLTRYKREAGQPGNIGFCQVLKQRELLTSGAGSSDAPNAGGSEGRETASSPVAACSTPSSVEAERLTRILRERDKQYNRKANQLIELRTRVLALADRFSMGPDVGQWAIADQIREAVHGQAGHPDG